MSHQELPALHNPGTGLNSNCYQHQRESERVSRLWEPGAPSSRPCPAHLMSELIARETEHHQATGPEAFLQIVHLGVVPSRCSSEGRDILNEQHLAPQGAQAHGLPARQRARGEGIHGGLHRRGEPGCTHDAEAGELKTEATLVQWEPSTPL